MLLQSRTLGGEGKFIMVLAHFMVNFYNVLVVYGFLPRVRVLQTQDEYIMPIRSFRAEVSDIREGDLASYTAL